jgi:hypothetical protein
VQNKTRNNVGRIEVGAETEIELGKKMRNWTAT